MLKTQVEQKSQVSLEEVKAYYEKNSKQFEHGETFMFQTISIIPPENPSKEMKEEVHKKIISAAKLAKATKTPRDFGLIAEQISDDDWRTKLGDRGTVEVSKLPPEIVSAARKLKDGEVSDPIAVDRAWVVIRVAKHTPAGKTPFAEAKTKLQTELQQQKKMEIRSALNQQLRKNAKIEEL
jgi:parvulin-like peptidyl-prolyl isomerase